VIMDTRSLQQESKTVLGNRETVIAFDLLITFCYEIIEVCFDSISLPPLLRIRIRKVRMILGLLDPEHPLVRGTDPDPSCIQQKY
jgi:hypothetical protein